MITIWLRELSTYNNGFCFDFEANLDNYSSSNDLLEDLFTYTEEQLNNYEEKLTDYSPFEEHMIVDYDIGDIDFSYRDFNFSEYESLDKLIKINEQLNELNTNQLLSIKALLENDYTFESALEYIDDILIYEADTMVDFAYYVVEELEYLGSVPDIVLNYIDYEKVARDLEYDNYREIEYKGNNYIVRVI